MSNPIETLTSLGQSLWYDNIQRRLLLNGEMAAMVRRGEIRGVTSNPSIFNKAIAQSEDYTVEMIALARRGLTTEEIYEELAVADIQMAADIFLPLYIDTGGGDGYISLEVDPRLALDTQATTREAIRLWERVERPNLMVKIPATRAGLPAITETIYRGVNVNVTLIFSLERYERVMAAYLEGLERRLAEGKELGHLASVASFFVSRIDTKVDRKLQAMIDEGTPETELAKSLLGRAAVASAKLAYQQYTRVFASPRFQQLKAQGAREQRPLWASTSTKNPAYSDVKYVEELIGPHTVNTVPPHTLDAFRDHGQARLTLETGLEEARQVFADLEKLGISMEQVTRELEEEGVAAFTQAFEDLLATLDSRRGN